jgi:hypothetical protein
MELQIILSEGNIHTKLNIDNTKIQKMLFIFNALEDGWIIEKSNESYIFRKKHEEKREYFLDSYLKDFIKTHIDFLNN